MPFYSSAIPEARDIGAAGEALFESVVQSWGWKILRPAVDYGLDRFIVPPKPDGTIDNATFCAQVKTGSSWFKEPVKRKNTAHSDGWWFRPDQDQLNEWLESRLPVAVILVDLENAIWYWQEICAENVQKAGKNSKIFVPRCQSSRDTVPTQEALIRLSEKSSSKLRNFAEIWSTPYLTGDALIRQTVLLPKLSYTQITHASEEIGIQEAFAYLLSGQARWLSSFYLSSLDQFTNSEKRRRFIAWPQEARLFRKVLDYLGVDLDTSRIELLEGPVAAKADDTNALELIVDCLLLTTSERRIAKLESILEYDSPSLDKIDRAWIRLILAIELADVGDVKRAQEIAVELYLRTPELEHDLSGKVILLGARNLSLTTGVAAFNNDVQKRADLLNSVTLWTNPPSEFLAQRLFEKSFHKWSMSESFTIGADSAKFQLRISTGAARLAGDIAKFKEAAEAGGKYLLQTAETTADATEGLSLLTASGANLSASNAAKRLILDGWISPLTELISTFDFSNISRFSFQAELSVLRVAGEFLPVSIADRLLSQLLDKLNAPGSWLSYPMRNYKEEILRTLCSVYLSGSSQIRSEIRAKIITITPGEEDLKYTYSLFSELIPSAEWTENELTELRSVVGETGISMPQSLQILFAQRSEEERRNLLEKLPTEFTWALKGFPDWSEIPMEIVSEIVDQCAVELKKIISGLKKGVSSSGGFPYLTCLINFNLLYPAISKWKVVLDYFSLGPLTTQNLSPSLSLLADYSHQLDPHTRKALRKSLEKLRRKEGTIFLFPSSNREKEAAFAAVEFTYWQLSNENPTPTERAILSGYSPEMALAMLKLKTLHDPDEIVEGTSGYIAASDMTLNAGVVELLALSLRAKPKSTAIKGLLSTIIQNSGEGALAILSGVLNTRVFKEFHAEDQNWFLQTLSNSQSAITRWKSQQLRAKDLKNDGVD